MKAHYILIALLVVACHIFAEEIVFIGEVEVAHFPESVLTDGRFIYASNIGERGKVEKDGDGYISKISLDGELMVQKFLPNTETLHSPTGMAIIADTLYVTDVDRVVGFDLERRNVVFEMDFSGEGATFLNDIVAVDESHLVVSATRIKKVYMIDLRSGKFSVIGQKISWNHPNGLFFDSRTSILYVAENTAHSMGEEGNGNVMALHFVQNSPDKLQLLWNLRLGKFIDGIALRKGRLLVSDWFDWGADGKLLVVDPVAKEKVQVFDLQIQGFADFFFDEQSNLLLAPHLSVGKISLHSYK